LLNPASDAKAEAMILLKEQILTFIGLLLLCDDLSIALLCLTESIPATPLLFPLLMMRTETVACYLFAHLISGIFRDEVGTRSLDQVPFFFLLACAPGITSPLDLAALLLLAIWLFPI
jgi:hypothetical protein